MNNEHLILSLLEELEELFMNHQNTVTPDLIASRETLHKAYELQQPIEHHNISLIQLNEGYFNSHHSIYENSLSEPVITAGQKISTAPWVALTHPNDLIFILKLMIATLIFLKSLPKKTLNEFNLTYKHRIKNQAGLYNCYILNFKVVLSDITGKPWLLKMHSRLNLLQPQEDDRVYRIISLKPYNLFKKTKLLNKSEYIVFTDRQQEIIKQVNLGFNNHEIANNLYISYKTLKKHFSNINKVMGIKFIRQTCLNAAQMDFL